MGGGVEEHLWGGVWAVRRDVGTGRRDREDRSAEGEMKDAGTFARTALPFQETPGVWQKVTRLPPPKAARLYCTGLNRTCQRPTARRVWNGILGCELLQASSHSCLQRDCLISSLSKNPDGSPLQLPL